MSEQTSLQNPCDHRIACEKLTLVNTLVDATLLGINGTNRLYNQTMVLQYPVATTGDFVLQRLGEEVPDYSYVLELDTSRTTISGVNARYLYVRLIDYDRNRLNDYEASYYTVRQLCNKCNGLGHTDDLAQDGQGKPKKVTATQQLAQDVEKYIRTEMGSNKYHPWVGTKLNSLIGSKVLDQVATISDIQGYIREAMMSLQEIQVRHAEANKLVTMDEILGTIESITVVPDAVDPTVFLVDVVYTARSGRVLTYAGELVTAT